MAGAPMALRHHEGRRRWNWGSNQAAAMIRTGFSLFFLILRVSGWTGRQVSPAHGIWPFSRRRLRPPESSVTIRRLLARAPDSSLDREDCRGREDIPLVLHHAALKTRNITTAVQFYSLLGFEATDKFRTGPARAAWLEQRAGGGGGTTGGRLEVIEVPEYMLTQIEGTRVRAPDLMKLQAVLGHNHVALDVTPQIHAFSEGQTKSLQSWMDLLNEKSVQQFGKTLRVALPPRQQIIGNTVYELAFLYDADGCLVELLHEQSKLNRTIESGWEPWDGQGFVGAVKG